MSSVPPPANQTPYVAAAPAGKAPILSILSLVGGVVGLLLACCWGAGFLFAVAGVVLGHLGRKREPNGKGLALAGLITGYVGAGLSIVTWILLALSLAIPGLYTIPGYSNFY